MKNDRDDILKKLIQKVRIEEPNGDFASRVMKNIQLETELELAKEAKFKSIFGDVRPESAPLSFDKKVMSQIFLGEKKAADPIISRQVWYIVAAAGILILTFCFASPSDMMVENEPYFSNDLKIAVLDFSGKITVLPIIYPAVIFALALLIMVDYFLRSKLVKS